MSLEMNANLTKMYNFAKVAIRHEDLDGEDSVIQTRRDAPGLAGRKWVSLGGRSAAFKQDNLATRTVFYKSVCDQFGGADNIPQSVRDVLKLGDFKLNAAGEVTSQRPLTARRISLVCEAVDAYNRAHDPLKFKPVNDPDWGLLPSSLKAAYRQYVAREAAVLDAAGSTDLTKLSVASFAKGLVKYIQTRLAAMDPTAADACSRFMNVLVEDVRDGELSVPQMRCLDLLRTFVNAEGELRGLVKEQVGDLPHLQQAQILQAAGDHLAKKVAALCQDIYARNDRNAQPRSVSLAALLGGFDFRAVNNLKPLRAQNAVAYMMQYIDLFKEEFAAMGGNANEKFHGKLGNKYENLVEALRCFKALRETPAIPQKLQAAIQLYQDKVAKREKAFNAEKQKAAAAGQPFDKTFKVPTVPASKLQPGREAAELLQKIMGTGAHAEINTAAQMLEAYNVFCEIDVYFFKALDMDRANGNNEMFDKLMDALNTTGCLQARCEFLQEIRMALDPNLANVKDVSLDLKKDKMMAAMGKIVQQLQTKETDEVDYAVAAQKLADALKGKDGQAGEMVLDFDAGNYKSGTKVAVTVEFLTTPEVADTLKACLPYFKD